MKKPNRKRKDFMMRTLMVPEEYQELVEIADELGYDSVARLVRDTLKNNLGLGKRKVKANQMNMFGSKDNARISS